MKKLKPKCHPDYENGQSQFGYSAQGYLLPCCWCDQGAPEFEKLKTEDLAVANNDSIQDIITSDAWIEFGNSLVASNGENAPEMCWKYCASDKDVIKKVTIT